MDGKRAISGFCAFCGGLVVNIIQATKPEWFGDHPWILPASFVVLFVGLLVWLCQYSWAQRLLGVSALGKVGGADDSQSLSPRLSIIAAHYGVPGEREPDVKNYLLKKPHDNAFAEVVSADLFDGFDPSPGRRKSLTVQYVFEGQQGTITRSENEWLIIPEDALLKFQLASCRDGIAAREEQFQLGYARMQEQIHRSDEEQRAALERCEEEKKECANRCLEYRSELARYAEMFPPLQMQLLTLIKDLGKFFESVGPMPAIDAAHSTHEQVRDYHDTKSGPWRQKLNAAYEQDFAHRVRDVMLSCEREGIGANDLNEFANGGMRDKKTDCDTHGAIRAYRSDP